MKCSLDLDVFFQNNDWERPCQSEVYSYREEKGEATAYCGSKKKKKDDIQPS